MYMHAGHVTPQLSTVFLPTADELGARTQAMAAALQHAVLEASAADVHGEQYNCLEHAFPAAVHNKVQQPYPIHLTGVEGSAKQ